MKKRCIGCKREIPWGQQDCPFCGAPQGFLRYHSRSIIVLLLVIAASGWGGYQLTQQLNQKAATDMARQIEIQTSAANEKVAQLQAELKTVNQKLQLSEEKLKQASEKVSASSSRNDEQIAELQQKLAAAEKEAKSQQGRAGWLGRENVRLKAELKKFTEQQQTAGQTPADSTTPANVSANPAATSSEQSQDSNDPSNGGQTNPDRDNP